MPEFDNKTNIADIISNIESVTRKISSLLIRDSKFTFDDIAVLEQLYKKRRVVFNKYEKLIRNNEAKNIINENRDIIERISKVLIDDKNNLNLIDKKVKDIRSKIRKLEKSKSVLLYSRD